MNRPSVPCRSLAWLLCLVAIGPGTLHAPAAAPGESGPPVQGEEDKNDRVRALVQRGNEARRAGRLREALATYRTAAELAPRQYEIRVLLADTLRRSGRDEEAMAEYARASALDPARAEAYTGRALIRRHRHDPDGAAALLEEALARVRPDEQDAVRLTLAETRRRQGRLGEAETLFRGIVVARPEEAPAHAGLARVAEDRGRTGEALTHWAAYLKRRPEDEAAALRRDGLAALHASIGALEAAVATHDDATLWEEIGRLRRVAGDTPAAAAAYRRALRRTPRSVTSRLGLALALRDHDPERAAAEFRRVLEAAPADGVALYNLVALAAAGNKAAAGGGGGERGDDPPEIRAWRRLIDARPRDRAAARAFVSRLERAGPDLLLAESRRLAEAADADGGASWARAARLSLRATLLQAAGHGEEAVAALHTALRIDPTDPWTLDAATDLLTASPGALQQLSALTRAAIGAAGGKRDPALDVLWARLVWWSGRGDEALALLQRSVADHPSSPVTHAALAEACKDITGRRDQALTLSNRAILLEGARPADFVDLALTLLEAGRASRAEAVVRHALETWPDDAPALSVLGGALMEQGRLEEAAEAYSAALAADPIDFPGLARGQLPVVLAALGRHFEARQALRGDVPPIPALVYGEAWRFARDVYRDRTYHGQDWNRWRDPGMAAQSPQDAWRAIARMLESLEDRYTRLRDPEETEMTWLSPRGDNVALDRLSRTKPDSRTVSVEVRGRLAYIRLANFTDPRLVDELREALAILGEKEGIVLDLRGNPGGFSRAADAVGDLLVGPGKSAGVDVTARGAEEQVTGGEGAITDLPLTVLVDEQTASAAERLARTLQESGRATVEGETTYGKGLAQMSRVLPGGATVLVSVREMLGADDRPIQDQGLKPGPREKSSGSQAPAD